MLVALDKSGRRTPARKAKPGPRADYLCPHCSEPVILRRGLIRIHHFAHKPGSTCRFGGGESERHLEFKDRVMDGLLKARVGRVEAEWRLGDSVESIADLWIETAQRQAAIEFQASPITLKEILRRTSKLHGAGVHLLWVLDEGLFGNEIPFEPGIETESRIPAVFRFLQSLYFGRVYVYTNENRILPVRGRAITPKPRYVLGESSPLYGNPVPMKGRMLLSVGKRLTSAKLILTENSAGDLGPFRVARFRDKRFWQ